jgi:plastocyanin
MKHTNSQQSVVRVVVMSVILPFMGCLWSATAAETNVTVNSGSYPTYGSFNPPNVAINVNDSVRWVWNGNYHSTTDDTTPPFWDSGLQNTGYTFTNVFTSAGHFPYECSFHYFQGSVNVATTGNIPPSVTITNPADGSVFSAPADVTLSATTSDGSGNVTNVQFFQGTTSLTNLAGGPFTIVVSGLAAGTYAFSAVATDTLGDTNSSAISISVVTPVAISLSNLQRLPGGQFQFDYTADVGLSYVVERSTSLPGFTPLSTNTAASSTVTFTDTAAPAGQSFYRVGRLPNP